MDKRGQIYILAAILFGFVLFMLTSRMNYATEKSIEDDFKELSKNYAVEASKFMNSILGKNDKYVANKFAEFTEDFSRFANNQNPDFGLIFLFPYQNMLYIGNYIDSDIKAGGHVLKGCGSFREGSISVDDMNSEVKYSLLSGGSESCRGMITFTSRLSMDIYDMRYEFELNKDTPEIVIIGREDKEGQIKVFMNNKVVSGEEVA